MTVLICKKHISIWAIRSVIKYPLIPNIGIVIIMHVIFKTLTIILCTKMVLVFPRPFIIALNVIPIYKKGHSHPRISINELTKS